MVTPLAVIWPKKFVSRDNCTSVIFVHRFGTSYAVVCSHTETEILSLPQTALSSYPARAGFYPAALPLPFYLDCALGL